MDELVASFLQSIPRQGYRVQTMESVHLSSSAGDEPRRVADAMVWPDQVEALRTYNPLLDEPALFYKFADLGPTPKTDEIVTFANHYGWLGVTEPSIRLRASSDVSSGASPVVSAEYLDRWSSCLTKFCAAMKLWRAIKRGDESYLASVIRWQHPIGSVSYSDGESLSLLIASSHSHSSLMQSFHEGELLRPAKVALVRCINEQLSDLCRPALLFSDLSYTSSHLYFECTNLLGVIWLQFAKEVENNRDYRRCCECQQPFIPNQNERGKRKKFCTDACKSRNYRRRNRKTKTQSL